MIWIQTDLGSRVGKPSLVHTKNRFPNFLIEYFFGIMLYLFNSGKTAVKDDPAARLALLSQIIICLLSMGFH